MEAVLHLHLTEQNHAIQPNLQVFELDRKLLQQHALPYVSSYTWELATLMRALDMDEFLPPRTGCVPSEEMRLRNNRLPRKQQRKLRCVLFYHLPSSPFSASSALGEQVLTSLEHCWAGGKLHHSSNKMHLSHHAKIHGRRGRT